MIEPRIIGAMAGGVVLGTLIFLALMLAANALELGQFIMEVPPFGFDLTYRIR
jgi:hypothetical protein